MIIGVWILEEREQGRKSVLYVAAARVCESGLVDGKRVAEFQKTKLTTTVQ
jgi:hypothetical protein